MVYLKKNESDLHLSNIRYQSKRACMCVCPSMHDNFLCFIMLVMSKGEKEGCRQTEREREIRFSFTVRLSVSLSNPRHLINCSSFLKST